MRDTCSDRQRCVQAQDRVARLRGYYALISATLQLLGIATSASGATLQELRELALNRVGLTEEDIGVAIEERAAARKAKDFAQADAIREKFVALGVGFQDSPEGTKWRPVLPPAP